MIRVTAISYNVIPASVDQEETMVVLDIPDDSFGEIYPHMFSGEVYLVIEHIDDKKKEKK